MSRVLMYDSPQLLQDAAARLEFEEIGTIEYEQSTPLRSGES